MAVQTPAAYGLFSQDVALHEVVRTLNEAGFANEDICMMLSPTHPVSTVVRDASFFSTEKQASAVTAGLIGWLSEFGAVLIPTVGFFIRSQAYFHALLVAKDSSFCGNSRALVGLGFAEAEAEKFERQLRKFGVLIYVSSPEIARIDWATQLLRRSGAKEAAPLMIAPVPRQEPAGISAVA
jgi:hypothetical protein